MEGWIEYFAHCFISTEVSILTDSEINEKINDILNIKTYYNAIIVKMWHCRTEIEQNSFKQEPHDQTCI